MAMFTMKSILCATALAVTSARAAALSPHPRDMTFLPRRSANESTSGWPFGPFSTDGRDIVDSNGDAVIWTGVNWPGSGTLNVPQISYDSS
jgi:endoglucanase